MNYEKERYVWKTVKNDNFSYACIYDSEDGCNLYTNELVLSRLNQQDKRIKELEKDNEKLKMIMNVMKNKKTEELQECRCDNCGFSLLYPIKDSEFVNDLKKEIDFLTEDSQKLREFYDKLIEENKKLKQSQKQLAINELLKLKSYFVEECLDGDDITTGDTIFTKDAVEIALQINNQIKELGR